MYARALNIAAHEAIARDQDVGPEHLLLGLLRDAEDPVGTDLSAQQRRQRVLLGLPDHAPHPIKLLVESRGLTLDGCARPCSANSTRITDQGVEEDVIPEPYRTAGIDVLLDRGLITATAHRYRPSDEVRFGLRLDRWQY